MNKSFLGLNYTIRNPVEDLPNKKAIEIGSALVIFFIIAVIAMGMFFQFC